MVCVCCLQECECNNVCRYAITAAASYDGWPASVSATATPDGCETCATTNASDTEENPLRVGDQAGAGSDNLFEAIVNVVTPDELNWYLGIGERYDDGEDEEQKSTTYSVFMTCAEVDNKAAWTATVTFTHTYSLLVGDPAVRFQSTIITRLATVTLQGCPGQCSFAIEMTPDGFEINGTAYEWDSDDTLQSCTDYDENGNPTACDEYLYDPLASANATAVCREECDEFP